MRPTDARQLAANLYLGNSVVLIIHEIDSAYWHEWELFGLPGGIDLFLILHIPLLGIVLWGYRSVVLWTRGAQTYSFILAFAGISAALIHGAFLAFGSPEFRSAASLIFLAAALVFSILLIVVLKRYQDNVAD